MHKPAEPISFAGPLDRRVGLVDDLWHFLAQVNRWPTAAAPSNCLRFNLSIPLWPGLFACLHPFAGRRRTDSSLERWPELLMR